MLDISDLLHTGRKNKTRDRRLLKSVVIDPKQRFGKGNRLQFFAGMESTSLDRLHLLTKCHVTQVCAAAAATLRDRFQTIRKMQRRESAARKAVAPQIFQAIRQVDMLQALAAGKCPPENSLDRPRQDPSETVVFLNAFSPMLTTGCPTIFAGMTTRSASNPV